MIVNYRTPELVAKCLDSLRGERKGLAKLKVIVVDGGSGDASADAIEKEIAKPQFRKWVSLLPLPINGGFGWANNQAILSLARNSPAPEFIHVLNPDTEVLEGAVATLVAELQRHKRCGAVGSRLLASDGSPSASAFRFPSAGRELLSAAQTELPGRLLGIAPIVIEAERSVEVDWVTGASVMFRSEALREVGLFDDGFFLYFEEVELMHRLRSKGWAVRHVPSSRVFHAEGAATGVSGNGLARSLPAYWYRSRRRYFALTGGHSALMITNLAWLAGRVARLGKKILRRPVRQDGTRSFDVVRQGFWPREEDRLPSVPAWGDPPGRPPAWMART